MKRLIVLTLSLSLAVCAVAVAATPKTGTFKAKRAEIVRGYDLSFKVDRGGARISNVVAHVLEDCSGESTSSIATIGPNLTWTVKNGRFSGRKKETADGVTVYTTLEGRFTTPTTAKGTIRQETIVAGSVCDTRKLAFTAKRG
jgi:hypothetical protein